MTSGQFRCKVEPKVPQNKYTDADLAIYLTRLQDAGSDCRDQLQEVKSFLEVNGVEVTDVLVEDEKPRKKVLGLF